MEPPIWHLTTKLRAAFRSKVMASFPRASLALTQGSSRAWSCRIWINSVNSITSQRLYIVLLSSYDGKKNLPHWQALSVPLSLSASLPESVYVIVSICLLLYSCVSTARVTLSPYLYFQTFLSHHGAICLPTCLLTLSSNTLPDSIHGFLIIFPIIPRI